MVNRNVQLEGTLTYDSTPLPSESLEFWHKLHSAGSWTDDGSGTTDTNGNATKTISLSVPNVYDFKVTFAGDSNYESSSAETDSYTVKAVTALVLTVTPQ